ncbi:hypothetical protein [Flavobacterium dankookense]|uniref:DUF4082 domain-containing protein n=1 Tax=Flavobacterium dankookense TaxID=706186 RepID=A0A4R6QH15_9FLAO|nr:hypothetical protein [Flavobacterium dankookense]TDP60859.1 hypothetical protein BC748_0459 [Flavobacterium dankookense]
MKKIKYILVVLIAFLFSNCDINDDGFYNNTTIDVTTNLVTYNPIVNYNVGDYLYVNADFSRFQAEVGQTGLLDLYATTGNAENYAFSYVIEKRVNETEWETVFVNDSQLQIIKGSAQNGSYVYGKCEYNSVDETYEYNVGFPLLSTGNYRLSFGYNSESINSVELRSINNPKEITLNINSPLANLDNNGYFFFNVN